MSYYEVPSRHRDPHVMIVGHTPSWKLSNGDICVGHDLPYRSETATDAGRSLEQMALIDGALDEPIAVNGSVQESRAFATDQLNPQATLSIADAVLGEIVPYDSSTAEQFLLMSNAGLRHDISALTIARKAVDKSMPFSPTFGYELHRGRPCKFDFTDQLHRGEFLIRDAHDLLQHTTQLTQWPDEYGYITSVLHEYLSDAAEYEYDNPDEALPQELRVRLATATILYFATFEYSVIEDHPSGLLHSFGALNWQTPKNTPMEVLNHRRPEYTPESAVLLTQWNAARALIALQEMENENNTPGVLRDLGYSGYTTLSSANSANSGLRWCAVEDILENEFSAPKSAEELLNRAIDMLEDI